MIVYLLAAFGLAYIVGHSKISVGFRRILGGASERFENDPKDPSGIPIRIAPKPGKLGPFGDFLCELIECPACFGFWVGLGIGFTSIVKPPEDFSGAWPFALACMTSGVNFILARLTGLTPRP